MEELQLRFLEKQLTTKFCYFGAKRLFFSTKKWRHHQKKVIALNTYIGTNVLVYERWLVLKVRYTAGRWAQRFRHSIDSHCLCMRVKNDKKKKRKKKYVERSRLEAN